jgi:selenocysteine lyase/cysteine desulfurase
VTQIDINFVRNQFPAFSEPSLEGFAHFENTGGSYACRQIIDLLHRYYRETKVQPYYGFEPSQSAGIQMDQSISKINAIFT